MLRTLPLFLLLTAMMPGKEVTQNALDLDGVDDRVTVPNASALIAGSTGTTLSCWFYPRNAFPGFPNFDGIAGFRNELDCDFYLLQLTATTLEARIRFGPTDVYTIEGGPIQLNAWNHAALVHDGTTLSLYVNGDLSASIAAPGTLLNTTSVFQIGNLTYQATEFTLDGRMDEIGLWKRALSIAEIQCLVSGSADVSDPDLVLYYGCDQGDPGGDNTSIIGLTDVTGHLDGQLSGFALTGAGSNFVEGVNEGFSVNGNVCPGGTYLYDGQELPAGIHPFSYISSSGCDSIVLVTVTEEPVNINVNATVTTLTSLNGSASWQWLDCDNGFAEILGASFQTFSPAANGSYAVEVTDGACVDTSACYDLTSIGLEEVAAQFPARLVPTVTNGPLGLMIDAPTGLLTVSITDVRGREVMRSQGPAKAEQRLDVSSLGDGVYHLRASTPGGSSVLRFVRE